MYALFISKKNSLSGAVNRKLNVRKLSDILMISKEDIPEIF